MSSPPKGPFENDDLKTTTSHSHQSTTHNVDSKPKSRVIDYPINSQSKKQPTLLNYFNSLATPPLPATNPNVPSQREAHIVNKYDTASTTTSIILKTKVQPYPPNTSTTLRPCQLSK